MSDDYKNMKNVFAQLDDASGLYVLGLCLATNDLGFYLELIKEEQRAEEQIFLFACSLGIIREVAKIIEHMESSTVRQGFTQETEKLFEYVYKKLKPFAPGTLTRDKLKTVRDFTFHYYWKEPKKDIQSVLNDLKHEVDLRVRSSFGDDSCLGTRYVFADVFRSEYVNRHLTKSIVSEISEVAWEIIQFTDSLLYDLAKRN